MFTQAWGLAQNESVTVAVWCKVSTGSYHLPVLSVGRTTHLHPTRTATIQHQHLFPLLQATRQLQSSSFPVHHGCVACCHSVVPLSLAPASWVPGGHRSAVQVEALPLLPTPEACCRTSCTYRCCRSYHPAGCHSAVPPTSLSHSPLPPGLANQMGFGNQALLMTWHVPWFQVLRNFTSH